MSPPINVPVFKAVALHAFLYAPVSNSEMLNFGEVLDRCILFQGRGVLSKDDPQIIVRVVGEVT